MLRWWWKELCTATTNIVRAEPKKYLSMRCVVDVYFNASGGCMLRGTPLDLSYYAKVLYVNFEYNSDFAQQLILAACSHVNLGLSWVIVKWTNVFCTV